MFAYPLLWLEHLVAVWLLVATLVAVLGRFRWRRRMMAVAGVAVLLLAIPYFLATVGLLGMDYVFRVHSGLFAPVLALGILAILGSLVLVIRGFRPGQTENKPNRAASWPLIWLASALVVILGLHALTFHLIEQGIQQNLARVQQQASELFLSVAPKQLPDDENAAVYYLQVLDSLGPNSHFEDPPAIWEEANAALVGETPDGEPRSTPFDFTQPELGEFLALYTEDIIRLHQAARLPHCYFDRAWNQPDYAMTMPEVNFIMQASRLLAVNARREVALGNQQTALNDVNAMFALARHIGEEPIFVSSLIAVALELRAVETLKVVLSTGPLEEDWLTLTALEPGTDYRKIFGRSMRGEQALGMALFSDPEMRDYFPGDPRDRGAVIRRLYSVLLLPDELAAFIERSDRNAAIYELPYAKAIPAAALQKQSPPRGLISRQLFPATTGTLDTCQRGDALHRCALAALALARYQARYGKMPENLTELTPEFLPAWPTDPYDDQPLRVLRGEISWVVYSIGPDGQDDAGAEIDWQTNTGDLVIDVGVWEFQVEP